MQLVLLWLSALTFATFGVLFLVSPSGWAATVDVAVPTPTARAEIRAMYGGLEIGIAAFLVWCALDASRVRLGLIAAGVMIGGIALGRLASILVDGGVRPIMFALVTVEAVAALLIAWSLRP